MKTERQGGRLTVRVSTSRRLVVAFSAVLVVFLAALAYQIVGLGRMEATFDAMKDHEEQMRVALQLEDAVRDQYGHAGRFVAGDSPGLAEYEDARARAVTLGRRLTEVIDEPDAIVWMSEIRDASAELDRMFREQIAPAVRSGDRAAAVGHERSYPLVALIEHNADRIFGRLQHATTAFRDQLVQVHASAVRSAVMLLVAAPVLVALGVLYLARSVARPLARLSDGAAAVAGGDLDTRIDIATPDEFGALAAEFNAMTIALKEKQERLVESEKLAGVGRLAAGVAHELNNPLQVMLGYLSLNRDVRDERLARQLGLVKAEALHCKEIVEGLLELSRPPVESAPVDLRALADDVAGSLRMTMQSATPSLVVEGGAVALGDRPKLRQVMFNLVKNALEAAGSKGEVHVTIRAPGGTAEVAVRDNGPGVGADVRSRVFEPFFTTKASGTGLGLAVSRAIALAHGGDIELRNGEPRGAVFTLRLPGARETRN